MFTSFPAWNKAVSELKVKLFEANTRLRKEYLVYAVKDNEIIGYYIPSKKLGFVYEEPVGITSDLKFKTI